MLGLKLELHDLGPPKMAWFPMKNGDYGTAGSLVPGTGYVPAHAGSLVYFIVTDIDAALARVSARGGTLLRTNCRRRPPTGCHCR